MYPWLEAVTSEFVGRLQGDRVAHALLLSGPAGTGKAELAAGFLAGLLCLEGRYPACGSCRSCALLRTGAHPDGTVVTFEPHPKKDGELRTEILVDQVRRLIESLQLTTTISRRKAAVVVPAEAMNRSAANALLKTLEEPPGDAVVILVSHQPSRLPATVRSRCQALNVRLPDAAVAIDWLVAETGAPAERAALALDAAAGSPLRARSVLEAADGVEAYHAVSDALDQVRAGRRDASDVIAALGAIDPDSLWTWLSLRAARDTRSSVGNRALASRLAALQRSADLARRLVPTPVRKDLLLRDWLIQWSRLDA